MSYEPCAMRTLLARVEQSSSSISAIPLGGQGLPPSTRVSCSRKMRESRPVGSCFWIQAKVTCKENGTPFPYASPSARYEVISEAEAKAHIVGR